MSNMSNICKEHTVSKDNSKVILPPAKTRNEKLKHDSSELKRCFEYSPGPDVTPHTAEELRIPIRTHNLTPLNDPLVGHDMRSFIYHNHEEFLSYTVNNLPKHNTVKMVGLFKHNVFRYFLKKYTPFKDDSDVYVILNVVNLRSLPNFGEQVEVYGHLEFCTFNDNKLPVLNVRFIKRIPGSIEEYIACLETQKLFIPSNYKEKVCNEFEDTTFIAEEEISRLFKEHENEIWSEDIRSQNNKLSCSKHTSSAKDSTNYETVIKDNLTCSESNQPGKISDNSDDVVNTDSRSKKPIIWDKYLIEFLRDTKCSPPTQRKAPVKQAPSWRDKPSTTGAVPRKCPVNQNGNLPMSKAIGFQPCKKDVKVEVASEVTLDNVADLAGELDFMKMIASTDFEDM